ncbi:hypothetical protein PAEH1_01270 [Paenalcaligenes hominis]|uniref:Uncharacterized protein n=1 Tax=Paenalcaligenes hominis TaxID=643674 RepID=A0A1U9JXH9_9BURK|nr:hypothetical protein PAEH1_01270 [Paenalcaligenes hominis]
MSSEQYYVVSVRHTHKEHLYITVWGPNNCGYRWALSGAGCYSEDLILNSLDYYNNGPNIAVPCSILDDIAIPPIKGHHDNDAGPCVENNKKNWQRILKAAIAPTKYPPQPKYKRVKKRKAVC